MVFDALRSIVLDLKDRQLAVLPLIPPAVLLYLLLEDPLSVLSKGPKRSNEDDRWYRSNSNRKSPPVGAQLYAYLVVSLMGYYATSKLIPAIKQYTLRKGISGKDLGKKGTSAEDKDIPEALGIVPGAVFLVCLIFCLVGYAAHHPSKLLDVNSALLSICFMLFLGFTDDVLDWPWRYKLFLPSVASLPLLCCYNGSTSIVVPLQLRKLIWQPGVDATALGHFLGLFVIVDRKADGALLDLRYFYLLYMGMLAVFCTNAINIYAGINGLEAGQSYVIACAVLVHNFIEIRAKRMVQNHLFAAMLMMSFVGVTLALTKHNWYPASVFVGDTFCYFAGMTFAVVGILGHFSKTLLLFFIPQIVNFIYSLPQLFRFVPCPRHRLPKFNASTGLMEPSTFECGKNELQWLKRKKDDTVCPNMTVVNLTLQVCGPMSERDLCVTLLLLQAFCCAWAFYCRYYLAQFFFDSK